MLIRENAPVCQDQSVTTFAVAQLASHFRDGLSRQHGPLNSLG